MFSKVTSSVENKSSACEMWNLRRLSWYDNWVQVSCAANTLAQVLNIRFLSFQFN